MTGLGRFVPLCLAMVALAMATAPDVARSQVGPVDAAVAKYRSEIPAQLRAGTALMRKALESLGDNQQAQTYTLQAYFQLRTAQGMMQNANAVAKFPDPFYALAIPKVQEARNRLLEALNSLKYQGDPPGASVRIGEALNVTEAVLLALF
jgi:hypothetical protein